MSETAFEAAPAGDGTEASDAALISRIREGDLTAYGELYERHVGTARGLAHHLVGGDAAEDAVQDAFAKILDALQRGGGPQAGFRPYLLTSVRRTVYDRYRGEKRLHSTDQIEQFDPGAPFVDPAVEGLERSMIVRAFRTLPERWQAVLWHTEVEGAKPAEVAPFLGLTANGVAALAYRAREGLRQAYLQMHLATSYGAAADPEAEEAAAVPPADASSAEESAPARAKPRSGVAFTGGVPSPPSAALPAAATMAFANTPVVVDEKCRPVLEMLGAHVRGGLAKRDSQRVKAHLDDCEPCKALYAELADINTALREALGPLVLGGAVTAYLAAAKGGAVGGGLWTWFRHLPKRQQQALSAGGTAAVIAAAVALAMNLASNNQPLTHPHKPPLAVPHAVPAPAQPKPPAAKPKPKLPPQAPKPVPKAKPKKKQQSKPKAPVPAMPAVPAKLDVNIGPVGALLHNQPGIVGMTVHNAGGQTDDLLADVKLPPDVSYAGAASGRHGVLFKPLVPAGDDWSCRPIQAPAASVRCTHAALPNGQSTSAYLRVQVGESAPVGRPPTVTLHSGKQKVAAQASWGVVKGGLPARFATDGKASVMSIGNSLMSCDETQQSCKQALGRQGEEQDDDFWNMQPVDRDNDPSTKASSAARLALPKASSVLWAGLYWSGVAKGADTGAVTARVRPPSGKYEPVRPSDVQNGRLPDFTAYQAFADVTNLVRAHGSGEWWGADVPTVPGVSHYAGWSLVVVVRDPAAPLQQVAVLDGPRALSPQGDRSTTIPLSGLIPAARPAHIGLVGWEGDSGLKGDRLLLDGRPLTPITGTRSTDNVFDNSSLGAVGRQLTFGTDVDDFTAVLGRRSTLSMETQDDALLLGVVTVNAPMRS
ncbi:sigma-70 family RNA polymerase sigma factor [Actinomadura oligospora]|uniref:sigma-70 family RNA polymerase sigma factor n=1 Tax=Actinomadura oligospora TaxID=111804 RepID=UPI0004B97AD7|nr:sigma-70 family RNA polymerase sigma factor [Actinomadura oligospora]